MVAIYTNKKSHSVFRKRICVLGLFALTGIFSMLSCSHCSKSDLKDMPTENEIFDSAMASLKKNEFDKFEQYVARASRIQLNEKIVRASWNMIKEKTGNIHEIADSLQVDDPIGKIIVKKYEGEKKRLAVQMTFNKKREIIGFFLKYEE